VKHWLAVLAAAGVIVLTGINPIQLTEYAVIFAVVIMPLTYYPILRAVRNPALMGKYVAGPVANVLGTLTFILLTIVAVAAVPLMVLSGGA
jgi:manganese transport protein